MVLKKKPILKKVALRKAQAIGRVKRRLQDQFPGVSKKPQWFDELKQAVMPPDYQAGPGKQPPAQQFQDIYKKRLAMNQPMQSKLQALLKQRQFEKPQPGPGNGMIQLDPREWNGGFDELRQAVMPPDYQPGNDKQRHIENLYQQQALSQNPDMRERIQGLNNGLHNGFNNAMNQGKEQFERALQGQPYVPGEVRGQGQEVGTIQPRPHEAYQGQLRPQPGRGMIQLDPRESGGFNRPPMKMPMMPGGSGIGGGQRPMPMPGGPKLQPGSGGGMIHLDPREWNGGFDGEPRKQTPMPMPGGPRPPMSGGQKPMPMPNPGMMKQMPMPNPRRNLIPRPIDPRYKAF